MFKNTKNQVKLTNYLATFYNEWLINPERHDYNIVADATAYGEIDPEKFRKSITRVFCTIAPLRSNVINKDGILYWNQRDEVKDVIEYFPYKLTDEEIYALVAKPFDLEKDLLARHYLIREDEKKYRVIFVYSHLIGDGVSSDELYTKWSAYYDEEHVDEIPLEVQAQKQVDLFNYFENILKNKQPMQDFWKEHLKDISPVDLTFLKNFAPKAKKPLRYIDEHIFRFDSATLAKAKSLKTHKITPYIFGQLVLAVLFYKLTGQEAIGIPYPIALMEGKDLHYGVHVNTSIVDYRFDQDTTVVSLIDKVLLFFKDLKKTKAKYLPIGEIIKYADNAKVLDIAFSQTFKRDSFVRIKGLTDLEMNHKFQIDLVGELLIEQEEDDNNLRYRIRYDKDVLDENLIRNFAELYQKLFLDLLEDLLNGKDDAKIDSYKLLNDIEYTKIIHHWNQTQSPFPIEKTIHEVIEDQVRKTPNNIALVCKDASFTYKKLNAKSNQLANYLSNNYVINTNELIAVCQNRTEHALISLLGVLKTGVAYVPMDPDAPSTRIRYMLEDADCKIILTNEIYYNKLKDICLGSNISVISVDSDALLLELNKYSEEAPTTSVTSNDLSYVIYTSGTTGNPKGVMIEHKGLVNMVFTQDDLYNVTTDKGELVCKKCLWYSNLIFDAHACDMYSALAHGHTVYMVDDVTRMDIEKLSTYISKYKIDHGLLPPALLNKDYLLDVKTLIVGGEAASLELMNTYRQQGKKVLNMYGPTEITVISSQHYYELGDSHLNIGKPFKNKTYYVLDKNLQILPIGAIGELHIGGIGIARGYLNNTELTSEKFIENPFQTAEEKLNSYNGRLYKTGDLVRYLSNGDIEYIGRTDFQVKIRGFRIELGEIEKVLLSYEYIKQVVVLAKEYSTGRKYLAAYYVSENPYSYNDLHQYLTNYLPDYMIPSVFIHILKLPMTVNGKLDRKALPEVDFNENTNYISPQNESESELCKIYGDVLGLDPKTISVEDDFIKLGGDSITGIQLVNRIRQHLNINLGVKDIFKYHTIHSLYTKFIENSLEKKAIKTEQGILEGGFDLLPIQKWFFSNVDNNILPDYNHWNQCFMLSVPELDVTVLRESINKLTDYHDAFRLIYSRSADGIYIQHYRKKLEEIGFDCLNINTVSNPEELNRILTSWQKKFDIYTGPLFHIGYIDGYSDQSARLHFSIHHLIIDAVSWRIIQNDLQRIYNYLLNEKDRSEKSIENISVNDILGLKGSSYREWTKALSNYKQDSKLSLNKETKYWNSIIKNISNYNLFWTSKRIDNQMSAKNNLNKQFTERLLRNIHSTYNTQTQDILIAALSLALYEITGNSTHYVTLEGHGRETISDDIDINNTIGWFTCLYPVMLDAQQNADIIETVIYTKDMLRQIPDKGVGYGAIFGYIEHKLPTIAFNYLGQYNNNDNNRWAFMNGELGEAISSKNKDCNTMSVNCAIIDGQLTLFITGQLPKEQLNNFAEVYINKIKEIISTLDEKPRTYLTLSDIDYIISKEYLDQLQKGKKIEGVYLANSLQQGFILHALNQGEFDSSYRTQLCWDYHNALDIDKLEQAWCLAQQKYPTLRLRFAWEEELVQIIDKESILDWHYFDLKYQNNEDQSAFLSNLLKKDKELAYDLSEASLFRVYLVKRNNGLYNCIFSNHHAILDGWSNAILIKYIHETYLDLLYNREVPDEPDKTYALAQRYLQNKSTEHQKFWKNYISLDEDRGDLSGLMVLEKKNTNIADYKYIEQPVSQQITISENRYNQLKRQCSLTGITINVFLQYCWHKLLSTYSGNKTTTVGMVVSGRSHEIENIEESVGLYINTLPVIVEHKNKKLEETLKSLQDNINEINARTNVNLADLQQGKGRLFNSLFAFENYPIPDNAWGEELQLQFVKSLERQDYPLSIAVFDHKNELLIQLSYAEELFDNKMISQLLNGFLIITDQFISKPEIEIKDLNLLSEEEINKLIYEWNATQKKFPSEKTIHELIEDQVKKTPDNIALVYRDLSLSYSELDRRSNALANYLLAHYQPKPDDLIAICQNRTEHMLISMLGILKAGAGYVPIDPKAPNARIYYMLKDAGCKILLTNEEHCSLLEKISSDLEINILPVGSQLSIDEINKCSDAKPLTSVTLSNIAYVIYTSGTTGNPKGVVIEHQKLVNLAYDQRSIYKHTITENKLDYKKCSWYSNLIFDAHVLDVYPAITQGHSVFLIDDATRLDLNKLSAYISENGIQQGLIPPVLLDKDFLLPMETLLVGGEATSLEIMQSYTQKGVDVYNSYGPTEITVCSSQHKFELGDSSNNIGKPISNTTYYILNEYNHLLPVGAVGELHIGGIGVARGYLNNTELTSKKFIPNPFQTKEDKEQGYNARLYKTGDLVRLTSNGDLEYIGRNDFQIKIRGFRIELEEIEQKLAECEFVKRAVVRAYEHTNGMKYLVGYYVSEEVCDSELLRNHLITNLPDYMVPSVFVHLTKLPMTPNGKLDYKKLPIPEFGDVKNYISPKNEMERQLRDIYADILYLEPESISVTDDFFSLGGSSIQAIKIAVRISKVLKRNIELSYILKYKTVKALSEYLNCHEDKAIVKIEKSQVDKPEKQLLSFSQERLWFIETYEGGSNFYNIPLIFKIKESTSELSLISAIQKIITRHEILRSQIKTSDTGIGYQQPIPADIPIPVYTQIVDSRDSFLKAMEDSTNRVFDISNEPPVHIQIYRLGKEKYISIVIHHIAFDGWSTELFVKELINYYHYYDNKQKNAEYLKYELPNLDIQYKDFALWQRKHLLGSKLEEQLNYWKNRLSEYQTLALPTDKKRLLRFDYSGNNITFEISDQISMGLRKLSKDESISLYSVLLSGYYILLSAFSGQKDIIIGTPIAGRNHEEVSNMIGFFVNIVVLRNTINTDLTLVDYIQQVGKEVAEALQHQDVPFEKLVEELKVEKDPSRNPIFQVMFGLQAFGQNEKTALNEILEFYKDKKNVNRKITQFDFTMMLDDSEDNIRGVVNYSTSLFEERTIKNYISTYIRILEQFVSLNEGIKRTAKIEDLDYLNQSAYDQLVYQFNCTRKIIPVHDLTIHKLFEQQVQKTPDSIALVYKGVSLSYRSLNDKANQLANYLIEQYNIGRDNLVAICQNRSEYFLISVLGVLKAGGAYVPMDPDAPENRLQYMLKDTKSRVILSNETYESKLKEITSELSVSIISIDSQPFAKELDKYWTSTPVTNITSRDLCYIIYTSGTTGEPKGVMIEHRGLTNLALSQLAINSSNIVNKHCLFYYNFVFDAHVYEIYAALINGYTLYMIDNETRLDINKLSEFITQNAIERATIPPVLLDKDKLLELKCLTVGGEPTDLEIIQSYYQKGVCIINSYGPTEITVSSSQHAYQLGDSNRNIGKPIANTTYYILDETNRMIPFGAIGELHIGGIGVARGYLNNPGLTSQKFINNPFQTKEDKEQGYNDRLYKTGDLVRYLPNGDVEYISRNDFQVKIRGFRIELEEIEKILSNCMAINQAVVKVREYSADRKYLIAYYTSEEIYDSNDLHQYLAKYLPDYMIPSMFVHLDKFPMTINGKLDSKALPIIEFESNKSYISPQNGIESKLCELYGEILDLDPSNISTDDDFFTLGGSSILSIRLVVKINSFFNTEINVSDILSSRTIAGLAQKVERNTKYSPIISLNLSDKDPLFMIHPAMGDSDVYFALANKLKHIHQCYGANHYNRHNSQQINNLSQLSNLYLSEIDKIQKDNKTYVLLGWSLGGRIALEIASQLEKRGVRDITVYLLDTWMINVGFGESAEEKERTMNRMMDAFSILESERTEIRKILVVEEVISMQPISTKLNYTKVVLFRAVNDLNTIELRAEYPDNNVNMCLNYPSQLEIIDVDSDHNNILKQEALIIKKIYEFTLVL